MSTCYILAMSTGPAMFWLQQLVAAMIILVGILLLSLLPARQVLMPLWPRQVNEFLVVDDGSRTAARALALADLEFDSARVLVQSRPLSVAAVEGSDGTLLLGYPVAIRSNQVDAVQQDHYFPSRFRTPIVHSMPPDDASLILMDANDQLRKISLSDVHRLYYPNRLGLMDRGGLMVRRIQSCWKVPCGPGGLPVRPGGAGHQAVTEVD